MLSNVCSKDSMTQCCSPCCKPFHCKWSGQHSILLALPLLVLSMTVKMKSLVEFSPMDAVLHRCTGRSVLANILSPLNGTLRARHAACLLPFYLVKVPCCFCCLDNVFDMGVTWTSLVYLLRLVQGCWQAQLLSYAVIEMPLIYLMRSRDCLQAQLLSYALETSCWGSLPSHSHSMSLLCAQYFVYSKCWVELLHPTGPVVATWVDADNSIRTHDFSCLSAVQQGIWSSAATQLMQCLQVGSASNER